MRVGQKNKLTYRWARTGSRPRGAHDQRTQSTYLFGAVCPERGTGAALVLPTCNTEAMQLHLDEIATKVAPDAHAILLLDQAGWHGSKALAVPRNISLLPLENHVHCSPRLGNRRSPIVRIGIILTFLSSLAIIFPNADLSEQVDMLLKFNPTGEAMPPTR